jgi:hypothetical protein
MLGPFERVQAGSPEWAERLGLGIKLEIEHTEKYGIERLEPLLQIALATKPHPWEVWPVERPCQTPDGYFQYAAGTGCDDLAKLVSAFKGDDYSLVRALRKATAIGEAAIAEQNTGGRGKPVDDINRITSKGTSAAYLLRRLARERPDILDAYEGGEFATPTAAARAAGFNVDVPPLVKLRRAWRRASPEDRAAFLAEIGDA